MSDIEILQTATKQISELIKKLDDRPRMTIGGMTMIADPSLRKGETITNPITAQGLLARARQVAARDLQTLQTNIEGCFLVDAKARPPGEEVTTLEQARRFYGGKTEELADLPRYKDGSVPAFPTTEDTACWKRAVDCFQAGDHVIASYRRDVLNRERRRILLGMEQIAREAASGDPRGDVIDHMDELLESMKDGATYGQSHLEEENERLRKSMAAAQRELQGVRGAPVL